MKNPTIAAALAAALVAAGAARAEILRTPTSINVNSQGATTAFISYGQLAGHTSVEAMWCGNLIPAAPDIGMKCDPAALWGRLPLRYNQSQPSGTHGFTDIMTIPQSLARRAYQAAERGRSRFFYVRRFESTTGGPDEYVYVECRLAGGGALTPLALVDVQIAFATEASVLSVAPGAAPPPIVADITYTGAGRLKGRWEIVKPGDTQPAAEDLIPAASLPVEQRARQRRYLELERFNVYLPAGGKYSLAGPDPRRLPTEAEGLYQVLLRVEASFDDSSEIDLAAVNEGNGVVAAGGAAGFPLPPLRYYVGSAASPRLGVRGGLLAAIGPAEGASVSAAAADLTWAESAGASFFQVEVMNGAGAIVVAGLLPPGVGRYRLPPFVASAATQELRWRVLALDPDGEQLAGTDWRSLTLVAQP